MPLTAREHKLRKTIADARRAKSVSQEALAAAMGVSRSIINRIETGKLHVRAVMLEEIARALDTPVFHFICHEDGPDDPELMEEDRDQLNRIESAVIGANAKLLQVRSYFCEALKNLRGNDHEGGLWEGQQQR